MLAFVADVHIGNPKQHGGVLSCGVNARGRHVLEALQGAVKIANGVNSTLVVLGDLFDTVRPEAQLIAKVQDIFKSANKTPVCLLGNHEMVSTTLGDHSLAPLKPVATVVEEPTTLAFRDPRGLEKIDLTCIPFQPGPAVEWLPEALARVVGKPVPSSLDAPVRALAIHLGIQDEATAPFLRGAHDSVPTSLVVELAKKHGFSHVFAGNWHDHRLWDLSGIRIEQMGALFPTGWNNPGIEYGHLTVLTSKLKEAFRVPGPRFVVVRTPKDLKQLEQGTFYVRSEASEKHEAEIISKLSALQDMGKVLSWEHDRAVDGEEHAAARVALSDARAAAKAGGDALAEYVEAMPLLEGVERQAVLEKARSFLRG